MEASRVAAWLSFTFYMSAAKADANPKQLHQIREHVVPAIEGLKRRDLTTEEVRRLLGVILARTQTIMGKDWQPTGEWMVAIKSMLGEARAPQRGPAEGASRPPEVDGRSEAGKPEADDPTLATRRQAARVRARARHRRQPLPPNGADGSA